MYNSTCAYYRAPREKEGTRHEHGRCSSVRGVDRDVRCWPGGLHDHLLVPDHGDEALLATLGSFRAGTGADGDRDRHAGPRPAAGPRLSPDSAVRGWHERSAGDRHRAGGRRHSDTAVGHQAGSPQVPLPSLARGMNGSPPRTLLDVQRLGLLWPRLCTDATQRTFVLRRDNDAR